MGIMFYRNFPSIPREKEENQEELPITPNVYQPTGQGSVRERFRQIAQNNKVVENETFPEKIKRNVAQNAARATETYIGLPGNLKQAFQQSQKHLESLLGLPNLQESEEKAFGKREKGSLLDTIYNPPTSNELRETATK